MGKNGSKGPMVRSDKDTKLFKNLWKSFAQKIQRLEKAGFFSRKNFVVV